MAFLMMWQTSAMTWRDRGRGRAGGDVMIGSSFPGLLAAAQGIERRRLRRRLDGGVSSVVRQC
jgi:hypothetical protein